MSNKFKETIDESNSNDSNKCPNSDNKKELSKSSVVRCSFGILFIIFAIVNGFHYSSLFLIAAGVLILPINYIANLCKKININPKMAIVLSIVLFVVGVMAAPTSENSSTDSGNDSNQTPEVNDKDSSNEEKDDKPTHIHTEEVMPAKDATCTETGLTEGKKCSECGETLVEQTEVKALGHTEGIVAGKDATCTESGVTEGKKCIVCDEVLVAQTDISTKGHSYEEGKCIVCGANDPDYKTEDESGDNKDNPGDSTDENPTINENEKYIVKFTSVIIKNNSVGNEWIEGIKYENTYIGSGDTIEHKANNVLSLIAFAIEEDDSGDDYGSNTIEFSKIEIGEKTSKTVVVEVVENKGKYKGNTAEVEFTITIERIA
ncbi:MAG: hypothetical protein IJX78_08080 [Bacilli bacterium]|nr:hypothetical protein [Bacilli bacterium]